MRFTNYILVAVACGLMAVPLAAQDVRFGVQGAVSFPTGDLSDVANLGLQLGAHARWNFHEGHGLMARADWTTYGSKNDVSTTSLGLGADYTYHFTRSQEGVYVLAGLSLLDYNQDFQGYSVDNNALGIDFGVGYDVDRHLGLQARVTSHNLDHVTMTALNLGVTYTF
jgi:hypothetical protein